MPEADQAARAAAEQAARLSYGRLLAFLSREWRDVASAEDALAHAFRAALETWPARGIPDRPEAWLMTAARRHLLHERRARKVRDAAEPELVVRAVPSAWADAPPDIPDERLRLLFVCAHPAIDPAVRTPLMLQTVLGLDAARIGAAFLVAPATMGQRLVRAKAKIRDAGIPFVLPDRDDLPDRLDAVLQAIYAAFSSGWDDGPWQDGRGQGLAEEAIWLGRVLAGLMPGEPEVRGLLALMLYCHARRAARRDADGRFVPLSMQDPARWGAAEIRQAEQVLAAAGRSARIGRFQLEAAVQSVHIQRAVTGRTDWTVIAMLYGLLMQCAPSVGVAVSAAAARGEAQGPGEGLAALDVLPVDAVASYQPYWAVRGELLARAGQSAAAAEALTRAAGLTEDAAVRTHLLEKVSALPHEPVPNAAAPG